MTIADRQHAAAFRRMALPPPPVGAPVSVTVSRWLVVTWDVAGDGARGTLEWRLRDTPPHDGASVIASAVWHPHDGPHRVMASLTAAPDDAAAVARAADDRGLEHLDIPGLLTLTFRRSGDGARVLYARTALLAALGVRGGRVDHPAGRIVVETAKTGEAAVSAASP